MINNFFNFSALSLDNKDISMSEFKDKYILVVNTASNCGFTPQFKGLELLYQKYKDKGFVVLGFPCNQFANQEPGDNQSISNVCHKNYGVSFPMFSKILVNGKDAHPIYKFLKKEKTTLLGSKIKWNFTKFLINKEGRVIKRFESNISPQKIDNYLQKNIWLKNI